MSREWMFLLHTSGLFYYQLGNINPKYRSTLHSIQLLAVVKCSYIDKYGVDVILEPMMEAVKELETVRSFSTALFILTFTHNL